MFKIFKRFTLSVIVMIGFLPVFGQEERQWSLQAGIGGIKMLENRYDDGKYCVPEDEGNAFYVSAGPMAGKTVGIDERNQRSCISIGMKIDIPVKPVSEEAKDNLLWLIYSWISSKVK